MRDTLIFLFGLSIVGLASLNTFGQNAVECSQALDSELSKRQTNVNTHLAILETYEIQMTEIQKRIQRLETRLAYLTKKPYRDPNGFRRDGAKRMLGHLRNEMEAIEQRIAWHRGQIWQLQAFITSEKPQPTTNHESMALESADLNEKSVDWTLATKDYLDKVHAFHLA